MYNISVENSLVKEMASNPLKNGFEFFHFHLINRQTTHYSFVGQCCLVSVIKSILLPKRYCHIKTTVIFIFYKRQNNFLIISKC